MDEESIERLRRAAREVFDAGPVVFAYLFGSAARGQEYPFSDVDVAVWLDPPPAPGRSVDLRLDLIGRLEDASGVRRIDLIVLNESPLSLQGNVVRDRLVLYSRDEPARVAYESLTYRLFLDFEIHSRPLDERFLRDIAEGRR